MAKHNNKNIPPVTPAGSTNIPKQSIPNNNFGFRTHYNWLKTVKYEKFTNNFMILNYIRILYFKLSYIFFIQTETLPPST